MSENKPRYRRTILGYKQYLILKAIKEIEDKGEDPYYMKIYKMYGGKVVWAYITTVVSMFEKAGLVTIEPKGRVKVIKLTDKGKRVLECAEEIMKLINFEPEL